RRPPAALKPAGTFLLLRRPPAGPVTRSAGPRRGCAAKSESVEKVGADLKDLVEFLYADLPHLFDEQGIDRTMYDDRVRFRDPITRHDTIDGYLFNIRLLKLLFRPDFYLHHVRQTGPNEITTRWTMVMRFTLLPWQPELLFTGTSVMGVNPLTKKFCSHVDLWDSIQNNDYFSLEGLIDVLKQLRIYKTPDLETPKYLILKRTANYEIRKYEPFVVVETEGDKLSGSSGFNNVAGYIFGKNSSSEKIPMTTPVFTQAVDDKLSKVSIQIVLPMDKDLGTLPSPSAEAVNLRKVEGGRGRTMATAAVEKKHPAEAEGEMCAPAARVRGGGGEGLRQYYLQHIHDHQLQIRQKSNNLQRLEAQRNDLNSRVRMLREELQLLQEPGSYVGEVVKVMGKSKVLVKVHPEGKYVVDLDKSIDITKLTPSTRVALRNDSYVLHLILPSKVDPLVNLMKVEKVPDSTYDMIGGLDQQIKEIKEVIELPIKHPELFESLGIAQPKGVLLYGPPGTGKTLLARAVAHHTDCTFIRVSGSELVQKYIGEGSRMVRELFVMAREHAPSIIFMDEIDSIGSARMESGTGNGDSEVQRTMLELLNQLDGFEASNKIKVLMATNRIDILDQALLRPGRIDRKIEFPNPNEESRFDILKIHSRKMNLMRGIDLKKIAEKMNGASGAELKAVCTEAGMFALRERRVHVTQEDFEMAVAKVMKKETEKNMSLRKLWK
ncbi:SOUL heme-binding protein, partial [Musa troglodytarum]